MECPSATAKVRSRSDQRSPPTAEEPTTAAAVIASSFRAILMSRSLMSSRYSALNIFASILAMHHKDDQPWMPVSASTVVQEPLFRSIKSDAKLNRLMGPLINSSICVDAFRKRNDGRNDAVCLEPAARKPVERNADHTVERPARGVAHR